MRSILCLFVLVGCGSEEAQTPQAQGTPEQGGAAASGSPGAPPTVALPALPEGQVVEVDGATSAFEWVGAKITKQHSGGFTGYEGRVVLGAENNVLGTEFEIDMATAFTDSEKLTKHLLNADFFDVRTFAKARFSSADVQVVEEQSHRVKGVLEFHGNSRSIEFPATIAVSETGVNVQAEFPLNRQDFGVSYPGKPDDLIKDQVQIKLNLNFPR